MQLVIVESPTKAKTITRFLGSGYKVLASFGHIRDLPKSKLGVDVKDNFEPTYVISTEKKENLKALKDAAKKADKILFATDEDREGEAISWHLAQALGVDPAEAERITFHEITKDAILHALKTPRNLDLHLVDAQQARRILDRLVGYELSPFLWRTVRRGLSAGRVQSVALRIVVEREREILAFKPEEYWTVEGAFHAGQDAFEAKLHALDGKALDKMAIKTQAEADALVAECRAKPFAVTSVEEKDRKASPPAPFTTSTLQQEANRRLGFSAKQTMAIAQRLYEGIELGAEGQVGLITYMRTDSVNLSDKFLQDAKAVVGKDFGANFALPEPRKYKTKSKGAQEAHEAIRPTEANRRPEDIQHLLDPADLKLYRLIWQRAMATQMADAKLKGTSADLTAGRATFRATGQQVVFEGYLKLYPDQDKEKFLPALREGQSVRAEKIEGKQHFTEPAARFSDASLVKAMEEAGIGRPSTYAPTIATLVDREYVERDDKKRLVPTQTGMDVVDLLTKRFPNVVDFEFTSRMEASLDKIAEGEMEWRPLLQAFYGPFHLNLKSQEAEMDKEANAEVAGVTCPKCGGPMTIKSGRFGKFLACANYPECKGTKPMPGEKPRAEPEPTDEKCPTCGAMMVRKVGRFGPFLSCSRYPDCKTIKNIEKTVMDPEGKPVVCPKCKQGQIIEKMSKKKKVFFSCNRYPDCDQAFWDRPTGTPCPQCQHPTLVKKGKGKISCPNEGCGYKADAEDGTMAE